MRYVFVFVCIALSACGGSSTKGGGADTFQELEDRLSDAGLKVGRTISKAKAECMWFREGTMTEELVATVRNMDGSDNWFLREHGFICVTRYPTERNADSAADRIKDVEQRPAFSWGIFVFEGRQDVLDRVKSHLKGP